jgi:hypothetical protein
MDSPVSSFTSRAAHPSHDSPVHKQGMILTAVTHHGQTTNFEVLKQSSENFLLGIHPLAAVNVFRSTDDHFLSTTVYKLKWDS